MGGVRGVMACAHDKYRHNAFLRLSVWLSSMLSAHLPFKNFRQMLAVAALFIGSSWSYGQAAQLTAFDQLQQVRLDALAARGDFYMIYTVDQSPRLLKSLRERIDRVNRIIPELIASPLDQSRMQHLNQIWQEYAQLFQAASENADEAISMFGTDIINMIKLNHEIHDICHEQITVLAKSGAPVSQLNTHLWAAKLTAQNTLTSYLGYSAGVNSLGSDQTNIRELTQHTDKSILALSHFPGIDEGGRKIIDNIYRKWDFIRPSLENYDKDNVVPFLVYWHLQQVVVDFDKLKSL